MKKCLLLVVVLFLVAGSANAALVLHWEMDSADDFNLGQDIGSYNNRTFVTNAATGVKASGMTSTTEIFFDAAEGALRMQTSTSRQVMGQELTSAIFTSSTQYTFSLWAKSDVIPTTTGNGHAFYIRNAADNNNIFKNDLKFGPTNASCFNAPGSAWNNNAYDIWDPAKPAKYVDPATWNMYTYTWNADDNMIRNYVNGVLRASYTGPGGDVPSFDPTTISRYGFGSPDWNNNLPGGWYKNFMIYTDALAECEVEALYTSQVPEPATIALLGLGGLALIRKRK